MQSQYASEMHCILTALKPLATWTCQDAIRECRAACGGHGYHQSKLQTLKKYSKGVFSIFLNYINLIMPIQWLR